MQNRELLAAEWDHRRITEMIEKLARMFASMYPGGYQDEEDLVQIGRMTAWESAQKWRPEKGSYLTYARRSTFNEIRRAAIEADCAATAPYRTKVLASKIRVHFRKKRSPSHILSRLSISNEDWLELRPLFLEVVRLNNPLESLGSYELPYSLIDDILSIKELTSEEQQIIRSRIEGTTDKLEIPATSLQRKLAVIRQKVAKGGYGNGS